MGSQLAIGSIFWIKNVLMQYTGKGYTILNIRKAPVKRFNNIFAQRKYNSYNIKVMKGISVRAPKIAEGDVQKKFRKAPSLRKMMLKKHFRKMVAEAEAKKKAKPAAYMLRNTVQKRAEAAKMKK